MVTNPNPEPDSFDAQFQGDGIIRRIKTSFTMNGIKLDLIGEWDKDDDYYQTTFNIQAPMPPQMADMDPPAGIKKIFGPGVLIWQRLADFKVKALDPPDAFREFVEFAKKEFKAFGQLVGDKKLVMPMGNGGPPRGFPPLPLFPPPSGPSHKRRR